MNGMKSAIFFNLFSTLQIKSLFLCTLGCLLYLAGSLFANLLMDDWEI